jgi:NADH-quinone oxidoreductase subunit M
MSELGGIAQRAPALAILLVIVALANIALPLTNSFVGEFLMFNGVFASTVTKYNVVLTVLAGLTIILSAVYTLNMLQKVLFGNTNTLTNISTDISIRTKLALSIIVMLIFVVGVFPKPMLAMTNELSDTILTMMTRKNP